MKSTNSRNSPSTAWRVGVLVPDADIAGLLEREPLWSVYALADLETPHREFSVFQTAQWGNRVAAAVVIYAAPSFTFVIPVGSSTGVRAIFAQSTDLPPAMYFGVRGCDVPALQLRYNLEDSWRMTRMQVDAGSLRAQPVAGHACTRLERNDLPTVRRLYALWGDTLFSDLMLENGEYFGVYQDQVLVAIAGTHTISDRYRLATIGNVYTHPTFRGRGLAGAVTGAVAQQLFTRGIRTVLLNVRCDNAAAYAVYRRLGFSEINAYSEGRAALL